MIAWDIIIIIKDLGSYVWTRFSILYIFFSYSLIVKKLGLFNMTLDWVERRVNNK